MSKRHRFVICNPELCIGCKACEKACIKSAYARGRLNKMRLHVLAIDTGKMPNQCRQCDDSPCANVCPTSALRFSEKSYIEFRENICIGCKLCTIACPYGAIHMEAEDIPSFKNDEGDYKVGCTKGRKSVALKCDLCEGRDGVQACIDSCPKGALLLIDPQTENHVFGKKLKGDQSKFIANVLGREYVEVAKEPEAPKDEQKSQTATQELSGENLNAELKESAKPQVVTEAPASESKSAQTQQNEAKIEATPSPLDNKVANLADEVATKDAKTDTKSENLEAKNALSTEDEMAKKEPEALNSHAKSNADSKGKKSKASQNKGKEA